MTDRIKLVQGQDFQLAGGGIGLTDTSITIDDFVLPNSGVPITMDMFGEKGYITLEPETQREENISFTGVTQNGDSTATITGVVRGLPLASTADQADYNTPDLSLRQAHSGGSLLRITNSVTLLQWFAGKLNDETIEGAWTFPGTTATGRPKNVVDADAILSNELVTRGEVTRLNQAILIPPTVDSVSTGTTGTSQANSLSWNHTTSNDFRLLEVSVICQEDVTISSITYNAVGLTFRSSETRVSGNLRVEKWTLTAPALGTNAILVTFSGNTYATGFGVSLNNVDQTSPIDATGTATNGSSTSASDSITTINNNSLILDIVGTAIDPQTFTVGSNQTLLEEKNESATRTGAISAKLMETAGATTMSYTLGTTGDWAMVTVSYKGVTNAGGSTIVVEDEGVVVGVPADTLNFTGGGVTVTGAGTTKTIDIPASNLEVQNEGVSIDPDVTVLNFTGAGVTVTQTSPGTVEVEIGSTVAVDTFDDFVSSELIPAAGTSTDTLQHSGNFAAFDTVTITTETNHPGIINIGNNDSLYGFANFQAGSLPANGLFPFATDFFIDILERLTYSSTWETRFVFAGGLYIAITNANIQYDVGGGPVVSGVSTPASGTWFNLTLQYTSGTLTLKLDNSTIFSGAVALSGSDRIIWGTVSGGANVTVGVDYVRTKYYVTR